MEEVLTEIRNANRINAEVAAGVREMLSRGTFITRSVLSASNVPSGFDLEFIPRNVVAGAGTAAGSAQVIGEGVIGGGVVVGGRPTVVAPTVGDTSAVGKPKIS